MESNSELIHEIITGLDNDDDSLSHFGVLGMKWGVRKDRKGHVKARSTMTRKARKDAEWLNDKLLRGGSYAKTYNKTYRRAQGKIRKSIRQINRNEKYKKQDFRKDSPLRREYYAEISKAVTQQLNFSAARHGRSPSKGLEMHFDFNVSKESQPTVHIRQRDTRVGRRDTRKNARTALKHADESNEIQIKMVTDAMGYIIDFELAEDGELSHGEEMVASIIDASENDLLHYGVLGMKWGVRKDRRSRKSSSSDSSSDASDKKTPAKSKKSAKTPTSSMSDQELRRIIERIELEQRFDRLTATKSRGAKAREYIGDILKTSGKQILTKNLTAYGVHFSGQLAGKLAGDDLARLISGGKKDK